MKPVETVPITLTRAMIEAIQAAVASGEYASAGEVVRDALRAWQRRRPKPEPAPSPVEEADEEEANRPGRGTRAARSTRREKTAS